MTATQIRNQLKKAFGVKTSKELKKHLAKTDLRCKDEMIHAAAVLWSYGHCYEGLKNRDAANAVLNSLSDERCNQAAYDAKHGFGAYAYLKEAE